MSLALMIKSASWVNVPSAVTATRIAQVECATIGCAKNNTHAPVQLVNTVSIKFVLYLNVSETVIVWLRACATWAAVTQ